MRLRNASTRGSPADPKIAAGRHAPRPLRRRIPNPTGRTHGIVTQDFPRAHPRSRRHAFEAGAAPLAKGRKAPGLRAGGAAFDLPPDCLRGADPGDDLAVGLQSRNPGLPAADRGRASAMGRTGRAAGTGVPGHGRRHDRRHREPHHRPRGRAHQPRNPRRAQHRDAHRAQGRRMVGALSRKVSRRGRPLGQSGTMAHPETRIAPADADVLSVGRRLRIQFPGRDRAAPGSLPGL